MSCEGNRARFINHATVTGSGSAAATAFGSSAAAAAALEQMFQVARNQSLSHLSPNQVKATQLLAEQKTRRLFRRMEDLGINPPTHSPTGLPKPDAQRGYAAIWDTLQAVDANKPLPDLAEQIRQVQQQRSRVNMSLAECLDRASRLRTPSGAVDQAQLDHILRRLPAVQDLGAFSQRSLGVSEPPELRPVGGGLGKGVSGAPVYILRDRHGNPTGILKVFPKTSEFGQELSALGYLETQGIEGFNAPRILNAGVMQTPAGAQGVLVTSYAPGYPLDDLIRRSAQEPASEERWQQLQDAVKTTARALARLHTSAEAERPPSAAYIERHVNAVREITQQLVSDPSIMRVWRQPEGEIRGRIGAVVDAYLQEAPYERAAVVHGDAHPGNFFFDQNAGVTFIDTPTLHLSLDDQSRGVGIAARDVSNFQEKLSFFGQNAGMSHNDIASLGRTFSEEYAAGGGSIQPGVDHFFRCRTALGETVKLARHVADGQASHGDLVVQIQRLKNLLAS